MVIKSPPRPRRAFAALIVPWLLLGCDLLGLDDKGPRGPGTFFATLVSPQGAEGSAVFEIVGGSGLGAITAEGGQAFYHYQGNGARIVIVLDEPGTVRFELRSEDVSVVPSATVTQVADGENQLRTALASYSVELDRVADSDLGTGGGAP